MIVFPLYLDVLKIKMRNGRNDKISYKLIIILFFYSIFFLNKYKLASSW
jgi:hypothetical protein